MSNNNYIEQKKNTHLYFCVGDNKYAVNTDNVLEIMKLPELDYPQKLPNNIIGLLKYNNFVINVIDIRFYLNVKVPKYNINNELLIIKTDEIIFGVITDKVLGILPFDASKIDAIPFVDNKTLVESLYKYNQETIFIINIYAIENILKQHEITNDIDILSLFPEDEVSKSIMKKRTQAIASKSSLKLASGELHAKNKYISFNLSDDYYCIELSFVKEVLKDTTITRVPGTPAFIAGIMNLRGDYITVLNLKKFLNLPQNVKALDKNPVIIVKCNELKLALLIDKINELFEFQQDETVENGDGYYSQELVYNGLLYTVLNVDKITSDKKIIITDM